MPKIIGHGICTFLIESFSFNIFLERVIFNWFFLYASNNVYYLTIRKRKYWRKTSIIYVKIKNLSDLCHWQWVPLWWRCMPVSRILLSRIHQGGCQSPDTEESDQIWHPPDIYKYSASASHLKWMGGERERERGLSCYLSIENEIYIIRVLHIVKKCI